MAETLWGKVYFKDTFCGILKQEPGGRCSFAYDENWLEAGHRPISFTLPLQVEPHLYEDGLHPFFDNLVAEGWLRNAQSRAAGIRKSDRFALLLAFGFDLAGAVSVIDPSPTHDVKIDLDDPMSFAALAGRASLSGVQPKIGVIKDGRKFRPVAQGELATHIAKLPSGNITNIIENEYLTTLATKALIKEDDIVDVRIASLGDIAEKALLVKRFDRTDAGERLHFEEFNQILDQTSEDKYEGCYEQMAEFILANDTLCMKAELDRLYRRIAACILLGNTDAHFKNFAMMHTDAGLRLTPAYDLVGSAIYPEFQTLALGIERAQNQRIGDLQAKNLVRLGRLFQLPDAAIKLAADDLGARLPKALGVIEAQDKIDRSLRDQLIQMMEKRWNGTFASIGSYLSKKP